MFSAIALTLFPEMFPGPLGHSLAGKALEKGLWSLKTLNIRDFAADRHATVDASPYGGGVGMILKPEVVSEAVEHARELIGVPLSNPPLQAGEGIPRSSSEAVAHHHHSFSPQGGGLGRGTPVIIYFTPRGAPLTQPLAESLKHSRLILLCGRFEGVDQRVINHYQMLEVSLGDFVLSGGEIAALALLDACVRLLPGVIGNESATREESFATDSKYAGLLEYPHYTRPPVWNDKHVPVTLLSGNHKEISTWRLEQAKKITEARRPDLWQLYKDKKE